MFVLGGRGWLPDELRNAANYACLVVDQSDWSTTWVIKYVIIQHSLLS